MSRAAVGTTHGRREKHPQERKPKAPSTTARRVPPSSAEATVAKPPPPSTPSEDGLQDVVPLSGDPREIEELVWQNSKDSAEMDVDFRTFGSRREAREKTVRKRGANAATVQSSGKFTSREDAQLKQQGFKAAGFKAGEESNIERNTQGIPAKHDPSLQYTGVSVYEPGWKKRIPRAVVDAGRGVVEDAGRGVVVEDRKPAKLQRLPFYARAGASGAGPKDSPPDSVTAETERPPEIAGRPPAVNEGEKAEPLSDTLPAARREPDESDEGDEVVATFVDDDEVVADFKTIANRAATQPLPVAPVDAIRPTGPPPPYGATHAASATSKPCRWFHSEAGCKYGARCRFAHS